MASSCITGKRAIIAAAHTFQIGQTIRSKPNVVSKYRNRLIAAGLIESAGYGKVDFAIPGLRQYLRR